MNLDGRITEGIAQYIAKTSYENLSDEAVLSTKKSILDTLGVMFPATILTSASNLIHDFYTEIDGGGPCTLIGYGEKASLLAAAMINGSLTHAVDFDDFSGIDKPMVHPTANCLPAALALAEHLGNVSGKDLITVITLANDIGIRMCACVNGSAMHDYDFFPQTVFGVFQSTIAASKLLDLTADQIVDALGLAVNRVAGIRVSLFECEFRSIRDAFGNEEGLRCAMLAARGFSGSKNALEVLYRTIYRGNVDTSHVMDNLGIEFYNATLVGYKPWPSCQSTHPYAQAVIETIKNNALESDDIEHIQLIGCENGADAFFPKDKKSRPTTSIIAKTALPYVVAVAALQQNLVLSDFEIPNLGNPAIHAMSERLDFEVDTTMPLNSAIAKIRLKNGQEHETRVDILRGNALNPMSIDEILDKFKSNAALAKCPLSQNAIERLADIVLNLEELDNMKELMAHVNNTRTGS